MNLSAALFAVALPLYGADLPAPREVDVPAYEYIAGGAFSPDSRLFAAAFYYAPTVINNIIRPPRLIVVDVQEGKIVSNVELFKEWYNRPLGAAFLADGRVLVVGWKRAHKDKDTDRLNELRAHILDPGTGKLKEIKGLPKTYEPLLVDAGGGPALVYKVPGAQTLRLTRLPSLETLAENSAQLYGYLFGVSRDGKFYARGSGILNGDVEVNAFADAKPSAIFKHNRNRAATAAFSPDGRYVVVGGVGEGTTLWSAKGALIRTFEDAPAQISHVSFDAAGRRLLACGMRCRLFKTSSEKPLATFAGAGGFLSPDGLVAAAYADDKLKLWRFEAEAASLVSASPDPKAALTQGLALLKSRDLEGAMEAFDAVLKAGPSAEALLGREKARHMLGEYAKAVEDSRAALVLKPGAYHGEVMLGLALQGGGDPKKAIEAFTRALALKPGSAQASMYRGIARLQSFATAEAEKDLKAALSADPGLEAAHFNLGLVRQTQGDKDGAAREYGEAIRLNPKNPAPYAYRGIVYFEQGQDALALADLNRSVELDPLAVDALNYRGALLVKQGQKGKAYQDFMNASNHAADRDTTALYNLGLLDLENGQFDSAALQFERAAKLDPGNSEYARLAAMAEKREMNKIHAANAEWRESLKRNREAQSAQWSAMDNAALAISRGSAGGGSSYGGSGGGSSYSGSGGGSSHSGSSGGSSNATTSSHQARMQQQQNDANRQQVERKIWNMSNPYK